FRPSRVRGTDPVPYGCSRARPRGRRPAHTASSSVRSRACAYSLLLDTDTGSADGRLVPVATGVVAGTHQGGTTFPGRGGDGPRRTEGHPHPGSHPGPPRRGVSLPSVRRPPGERGD